MNAGPLITNALLRIDEYSGALPAGFERPRKGLRFAVMELGEHDDIAGWRTEVERLLMVHAEFLHRIQAYGGVATLFVESGRQLPVLKLDAAFLRSLSNAGISLECSHETA